MCRVTPFHFYLAFFRTLLLRYSNDAEDLCIGIANTNRVEDEMMEIIGPLVNLLPLRLRTQQSSTFESLVQEARAKAYSAMTNSRLPFPALLSQYVSLPHFSSSWKGYIVCQRSGSNPAPRLSIPRSATHTSLFQCFIDYRLGQRTKTSWGDNNLHFMDFKNMRMACDIALDIVDDPDGICFHIFEVNKELYGKSGAHRLAKSYECLVKAFAADPHLSLGEPVIFQAAEIQGAVKFGQGQQLSLRAHPLISI